MLTPTTTTQEHQRGGHFAALEAPDELVADLRDFYPHWYKSKGV